MTPVAEPPEVVGREQELEAVRAFAVGDGFAALVLEGEAGIGKTTLLREAVAAASGAGASVLMAWPAPAEAALAFSGLGDLLADALDEVVPELPAPQAKALEIALLRRQAGERPVDAAHRLGRGAERPADRLPNAARSWWPSMTCSGSIAGRRPRWRSRFAG